LQRSEVGPIRQQPSQHLTRIIRSTWFALLGRASDIVRVLRRRRRAGYESYLIPSPPDSAPRLPMWQILDPTGKAGIFHIAHSFKPDVLLFVTRMDESRAAKEDRLEMLSVAAAFGNSVFERMVFVLTHGHSLPPVDLTYMEYMRGRRDSIWRSLTAVIPPVRREMTSEETVLLQSERPADHAANSTDLPATQEDRNARSLPVDSNSPQVEFSIPPEDMQLVSERGDVFSNFPSSQGEEMNDGNEEEDVVYDDPPPPEIAVVELSELCPRNSFGNKMLPDGTAWMPELHALIGRIGSASKRHDAAQLSENLYCDPARKVTLQERIRGLFRRGLWVLAVEVLSIVLILRGVQIWEKFAKEREARHRREHGDLMCALDEEEFALLAAKDDEPDGGPGRGYEDADEYFFGPAEAGEEDDAAEVDVDSPENNAPEELQADANGKSMPRKVDLEPRHGQREAASVGAEGP
jgi:hypothetical protein